MKDRIVPQIRPRGGGESSYYGMSVINPPVWEELEIAGYLFLGGLAGASSILAAGAELSGAEQLSSRARMCSSAAISLSLVALIKDLGRPARFLNMLRVFKPTSPMSVGTWVLCVYSPLSYAASASAITARAPRAGTAAGIGAALTGSVVATYTGALICDTAVPAWHEGHREMPFLFAASAAMAAGGFGLIGAPLRQSKAARRLALLGAAGELTAEALYERRLRDSGVEGATKSEPAARRLRLAKGLAIGGAALAAVSGRSRALSCCAGAAALTASALTRFGIFAAGMESAQDPRYTVEPQRARQQR